MLKSVSVRLSSIPELCHLIKQLPQANTHRHQSYIGNTVFERRQYVVLAHESRGHADISILNGKSCNDSYICFIIQAGP
jgi:hypothetical protein